MNLPRLAVKRPITTTMILVSVLVLSGIAFKRLPLAFLPQVDVPFIGITVPYPNSNPLEIEKEVVKPVEEVLSTLSGIKTLNATARADEAEFFLEFDWGQELDIVRMQVGEKIDQVRSDLPSEIGEIIIVSFNTSDIPVVQARLSAEGVDLSTNYSLIEARILNRIRRVPGVARVSLDGVSPQEIDIELILDRIQAYDIDVGALVSQLAGASSNLVLGQVEEGGMRFSARALGDFESIEEIGLLEVNEAGVKLNDIAEITYEEPPHKWGRHLDRKEAVALDVFKESTANTVDVVEDVMAVIEGEISGDPLLDGVNLFVWEDQAEAITGGINGLLKAGVLGALLAIFSLYFFLRRLDSTLIVSLSIPFSIITACGTLYFLGNTLNILSMMGLMLAVGMLVDNAVVVLESIDRVKRGEQDSWRAALTGARQVSMAVAASTLTTIIVFLPLVLGSKTQLTIWLKEIGVTITIALVCSLFSSLTLIPLMAARFLGDRESKPIPSIERLEARYSKCLDWTLVHPWKTFGLLLLGLGIGFLPLVAGFMETSMFSGGINERLRIEYEFSDFTYKSEAGRVVDEVEEFLDAHRQDFLVDSLYSFFAENTATTTLVLARSDLDDDEIKELRTEIRDRLPQIAGVDFLFDDDADEGGSSTYFAVKLFGQDTGVLEDLAREAARRLETVADVQDVRTSFRGNERQVEVKVDREKAALAGVTAQDMADVFSFTLGAMRLPRFNAGEREVDTWLALRIEDRENIDDLKRIQIGGGAEGRPVLLGDIANFQLVPLANEIEREDRKVKVSVRAVYEGEEWEDSAKDEIAGLMDAFDLPAGYSWSWNDRIVEQADQNAQMLINFLLAIALVYLVMASLFESLAQPFAILFSILFALPGAVWAMVITDTAFNIMSQIGLLILMGIVVNNGIVLLDHINQLRRGGMDRESAIVKAGRERLRPILMTATTTIIGLVPLAIRGPATGGVFYYPLARTVIGGLISSAILTLLILPFLTVWLERFGDWLSRLWDASEGDPNSALAGPKAKAVSASRAPARRPLAERS